MSNVEIKLNEKNIQSQLLRNGAVIGMCMEVGGRLSNSAEGNYKVSQMRGSDRNKVIVSCADKKTYLKNLRERPYLVDALGGIRK